MKNVMVDIETISTKPNAAIIAIGACDFDIKTGEPNETFYANIDWNSNLVFNRHVDLDTVQWWMKQSESARMALFEGESQSFGGALVNFAKFFKNVKGQFIWSHATFDERILDNAYEILNFKKPWTYRDIRDIRTFMGSLPQNVHDDIWKTTPRAGTHHNALADAMFQCRYVSKAWQYLNGEV